MTAGPLSGETATVGSQARAGVLNRVELAAGESGWKAEPTGPTVDGMWENEAPRTLAAAWCGHEVGMGTGWRRLGACSHWGREPRRCSKWAQLLPRRADRPGPATLASSSGRARPASAADPGAPGMSCAAAHVSGDFTGRLHAKEPTGP